MDGWMAELDGRGIGWVQVVELLEHETASPGPGSTSDES